MFCDVNLIVIALTASPNQPNVHNSISSSLKAPSPKRPNQTILYFITCVKKDFQNTAAREKRRSTRAHYAHYLHADFVYSAFLCSRNLHLHHLLNSPFHLHAVDLAIGHMLSDRHRTSSPHHNN